MGEYRKSLDYQQKVLEIREKALNADHPELAYCYQNIGIAHLNLEAYEKAMDYQQKAARILEAALPEAHPARQQSGQLLKEIEKAMGKQEKPE